MKYRPSLAFRWRFLKSDIRGFIWRLMAKYKKGPIYKARQAEDLWWKVYHEKVKSGPHDWTWLAGDVQNGLTTPFGHTPNDSGPGVLDQLDAPLDFDERDI